MRPVFPVCRVHSFPACRVHTVLRQKHTQYPVRGTHKLPRVVRRFAACMPLMLLFII